MAAATMSISKVLAALILVLVPVVARTQPASPTFQYTPVEAAKPAEKKLEARGGLVQLGGNSDVLTGNLGLQGAYQLGVGPVFRRGRGRLRSHGRGHGDRCERQRDGRRG